MPPEDLVKKNPDVVPPVIGDQPAVTTEQDHVSPVEAARIAAWTSPIATPPLKTSGDGQTGSLTSSQTLDMNTPQLFERVAQTTKVADQTAGITDQTQPVDNAFAKLLGNKNIDRSKSNGTDNADDPTKGQQLPERKAEDIHTIEVRVVHKDANGNKVDQRGNPVTDDANYKIGKDGKIEELIPPNKKAYGDGDDKLVVEIDASETNAVNQANDIQKASAAALIADIQAAAHQAGVAPDIPPDLLAALNPKPAPPPRSVVRRDGGGGAPAGGGSAGGGNGGGMGGGEGFSRGGAPRPQRQMRDVAGAEKAGNFDMKNMDFSHLKIPEHLKPTIEKMVSIISKQEGKATSINWNDNGYGISVGMFQANQKAGELPTLLKRMHDDNPQKFDQIFGSHAKDMLNEQFVRSAAITKGSELGNMMQRALNEPVFQQTQLNMIAEKVVKCAEVLKEKTGITSEKGVMLFADAVNQLGFGGASKYLRQGMTYEQMDASLRQNSWRASRNRNVDQLASAAGLSTRQGSFNLDGIDGQKNA